MRVRLRNILRRLSPDLFLGVAIGTMLSLLPIGLVLVIPGFKLESNITLEGLLQLVLTFVLTLVVLHVGHRFADNRAAKDLIIGEIGQGIEATMSVEAKLNESHELPEWNSIRDTVDSLGKRVTTASRLLEKAGFSGAGRDLNRMLTNEYVELRRLLGGVKSEEDELVYKARMASEQIRVQLLDQVMEINYSP